MRSALVQRPAVQHVRRPQPRPQRRRLHRCVRAAAAQDAVAGALALLLAAQPGVPDLYAANEQTAAAVSTLVSQPHPDATAAVALGDGRWEVFFGPHFRRVEALAKFRPVRYVISDGGRRMRSDVHYEMLGTAGWLSTEGSVKANGDGSVNLLFETFWVEGDSAEPRADNPLTSGAPVSASAALVNAVGKLGFLPSLSRFPVLFMDAQAGVCVFEFPPLNTVIAAKRV